MSVNSVLRPARVQPLAVIEVLKPVTWFPPMWALACGAVSAGAAFGAGDLWLTLAGMVLAGPVVCAMSQAVNDWFDRHVDAVNEPGRPIPSGRLPGRSGLWIAIAWTGRSLALGASLGAWAFGATLLGVALAWAYSAPPIRLKRNGWFGNAAVAICYEGVPWFTGAALVIGGLPSVEVVAAALLYSAGCHGIMVLNDFKALRGDRQMGVGSLPVRLGPERAARLACWTMVAPQILVIAGLLAFGAPWHAAGVGLLLGVQLWAMRRLLGDPEGLAPWYNGAGVGPYVLGMMLTAHAIGWAL